MKRDKLWILVADAHRSRLYRLDDDGEALEPTRDSELVANALPSRDIASDRPGRAFDSGGEGRHAHEPSTDPARHEDLRFAKAVVDRLEEARKRDEMEQLVVVAPPRFLGDLRNDMSDHLARCVVNEINKDLSKLKPHELLERLWPELPKWVRSKSRHAAF